MPNSILVIGAGYTGVEIAQMFARAGAGVTLVHRCGLLPEMEPETGEALTRYFEDEGLRIITVNACTRIEAMPAVVFTNPQVARVD